MRSPALACLLLCTMCPVHAVWGQSPPTSSGSSRSTSTPSNPPGEQPAVVLIDRAALHLRSPEAYRVPLVLQPSRKVVVSSRMEGVVFQVHVTPEQKVAAQEEVVRLEQQPRQLELERANALLRAEQLTPVEGSNSELREARITAAKAAADLARFRLEETQVRSPLVGVVTQVHVQPGEYVHGGTPLVTIIDPGTLAVIIPLERDLVRRGESIPLQIEGRRGTGRMESLVIPPPPEFEPLRDLFASLVAVKVVIDNSRGEWEVGQTVLSELVPRHPIAEVPNRAIQNNPDGERRVQVLREGFVRELPVTLLGPVGDSHVYVSARFQPGDELIVSASEPLPDGTWLRPRLATTNPAGEPGSTSTSRNPSPTPPRGGF